MLRRNIATTEVVILSAIIWKPYHHIHIQRGLDGHLFIGRSNRIVLRWSGGHVLRRVCCAGRCAVQTDDECEMTWNQALAKLAKHDEQRQPVGIARRRVGMS